MNEMIQELAPKPPALKENTSMSDTDGPLAAVAPVEFECIDLPGGNTVSILEQQPHLTIARPNGLKPMGGSDWPKFNEVLLKSTMATIPNTDPDAAPQRVAAVSAALAGFRPTDEIEGMIASQAVALHHAAMECFRRAMIPDQHPDVASRLRKDGANLTPSDDRHGGRAGP